MRITILSAALILAFTTTPRGEAAPTTGPATAPATLPSVENTPELQAATDRVKTAREAVARESRLLDEKLSASREFVDAKAAQDTAAAAYEQAKAAGTIQDRLAAGAALNRAKKTVADLTKKLSQGTGLSAAVAECNAAEAAQKEIVAANLAASTRADAAKRQAALEATPEYQIQKAIKEKRIIVGMTLAQATQAIGAPPASSTDDKKGTVECVWLAYEMPRHPAQWTNIEDLTHQIQLDALNAKLIGKLTALIRKGVVVEIREEHF